VVAIEAGVTVPGFAERVTTVPLGAAAPLATTFTATWVDVPQLIARFDGFRVTDVGPGVGVTVGMGVGVGVSSAACAVGWDPEALAMMNIARIPGNRRARSVLGFIYNLVNGNVGRHSLK